MHPRDRPGAGLDRLQASFDAGKQSAIVIVAAGRQPGRSIALAEEIRSRLGIESRVAVLGHIQRGGTPTRHDRLLASALGVAAVEALFGGKRGLMVGMDGKRTATVPLMTPSAAGGVSRTSR